MPNLDLAKSLRMKHQIALGNNRLFASELVKKGFVLTDSFDPDNLRVSPEVLRVFEERKTCQVVLIFVDITGFSKTTVSMDNDEIVNILESYYGIAIPKVYEHGGEVEKLIGDGIIAVFGEPFMPPGQDPLRAAERCCTQIIRTLHGSNKEVKCALHTGGVFYLQSGAAAYHEFTIIGKTLTELFRLESVGKNNAIAFYTETPYEKLNIEDIKTAATQSIGNPAKWFLSEPEPVNLPGVDFKHVRFLEYRG